MSTTTTNLGLTKPANNEYVDVAVINSNYDIIDQFAGAVPDDISELEDVAISSPSNGQVLKYNGASQKWENGSESSHSLNDMSDVTLSTPTNGQILKYNSSSDQWVNGDEVEPINVIANPSATATDTLTKLQVGSSVYSVPQGGTGGNSVSWNQVQADGTKIAEVTIDGATTNVLAPTPTTVVANPGGSATADLTSIQIGATVYSVPQGGGSWTEGDTYYIFSFDNTSGGSMTATEYLVEGGSTTQVQTGTISFASIIGGGPQYIEFSDIEIRWNSTAATYNINCLVDKVQYGGVQYGENDNVFSVAQAGTPVSNQRIDKLVQGGSEVSVLTDLQDVTVSSVTNGQVLKFNSTSQKWENANEDSVSIGIDDLTDVDITTASNAQVLSYNGTSGKWVNTSLPSTDLDDLTDVALSNPANGQVLKFNSSTNKWENANESGGGGGASALTDLTDVAVSSATNGQALVYDNATSKWVNGNQSVSGLSDTTITTPTNGQVLKYDSANSVWVNANESGGTTVVANPSGTATADLEKLQVGSTIYGIPDEVVANPSGTATVELETLQVGSTIYSLPEGGSGGSSDYIDVVGTLTAGSTSITLSSPKIKTGSCVFPWASVFGLTPTNMVVQNGSVTLTFPAQQSDVDVMVRVTKLNTGHVYDIDLSTLQADKSWFYYDNVLSSVNDTGDGLQLSGNDTRSDWTTSATIGINIANMIGTIPVGLTAIKLHFKTFEMDGYTGVRFINSNTLYTGQAGGSDAMLRTNGFYQFENNNSSIDEDNYELTVPCTASNLANSYLYIMFFDGMVAGSTNTYNNSLNGSYNIIIDGIDYVTGGN